MSQCKILSVLCGLLFLTSSNILAADKDDMVSEESSCEENAVLVIAQAGSPEEPASGAIQERAVPRMGPGGVTPPITRLEGGVLEGNRLRANPGYTLQPLPGGKVMLRPNSGGNGVEASCRCPKTGGCSVSVDGGLALCIPSSTNGCKVSCLMILGAQRSGGNMMMQ
ncbi:MAG: hypothetical protein KF814_05250 [Nitrospiraceae bacterium]|nr:hypothetical protein [Nitrospiraceae bacterium]